MLKHTHRYKVHIHVSKTYVFQSTINIQNYALDAEYTFHYLCRITIMNRCYPYLPTLIYVQHRLLWYYYSWPSNLHPDLLLLHAALILYLQSLLQLALGIPTDVSQAYYGMTESTIPHEIQLTLLSQRAHHLCFARSIYVWQTVLCSPECRYPNCYQAYGLMPLCFCYYSYTPVFSYLEI